MRAKTSNSRVRQRPKPRLQNGPAEILTLDPADAQRLKDHLLENILDSAKLCREIEEQLRQHPAPELTTIIQLYRMLVLKLSAQVQAAPELLQLVTALLKPVMDWARIEEQREDRQLARQKHQDLLAAHEGSRDKAKPSPGKALSDATRAIIERELKLF